QTIGSFVGFGGAGAVECMALAGMDYCIVDTEHGPYDVESTMDFIRAAEMHEMTPLVRVKDGNRNSILKMLDIGAKGLIIPFLDTVDAMKDVVSYGKYFPLGDRGVAFGRGAGYGYADHAKKSLTEYFEICNRETLLIPQCECVGCLEHIEEIVALDGIDGIFVGPFDLSASMGMPGQFDHPDFKAAVARILKACKDQGKLSIVFCSDSKVAKTRLEQGFDSVMVACDYTIFTEACQNILKELR
ncbi:MAG: aldolase/citrate lyase family protein, partial [Lachnospiraceae bacterium]|nr:aldolase/citrate lyase family protein [Lachnospiraceae bacterium]